MRGEALGSSGAEVPGRQVTDHMRLPESSLVIEVPLRELREGVSPRLDGLSEQHIQEMLGCGVDGLPPLTVHRGTMTVIDGLHRLRALRAMNEPTAKVRFVEADPDQLFMWAVSANIRHGLPLTIRDKKCAAERMIANFPRMSDRAIGRVTGLSPKTVGRLRPTEENPQLTGIGQDGKVDEFGGFG